MMLKLFNLFILLSLILTLFVVNCSRSISNGAINIKILNSINLKEGTKSSPISIGIFNNTSERLKIWIMSCSWQDNFLTNFEDITLQGTDCDSNFPELVEILPFSFMTFNGTIYLDRLDEMSNLTDSLAIGFVLIKESELSDEFYFRDTLCARQTTLRNTIWSRKFSIEHYKKHISFNSMCNKLDTPRRR